MTRCLVCLRLWHNKKNALEPIINIPVPFLRYSMMFRGSMILPKTIGSAPVASKFREVVPTWSWRLSPTGKSATTGICLKNAKNSALIYHIVYVYTMFQFFKEIYEWILNFKILTLRLSKCFLGPIPDSIKIWGEFIVPPQTITSFLALTLWILLLISNCTP